MNASLDLAAVCQAASRIAPYIHRTPVMRCANLDALTGAELFFKCENLQNAGAFKTRGACNAVFSLSDQEAHRGVVTHSSGNHAAALARAARMRGIPAFIVMPENSSPVKVAAVESYGGQITFCAPNQQAREKTAHQVQERTAAALIHPYDDARIIAGQGTAALEFLEQQPELEIIMAPVGGGGLLSGTLIAVKEQRPELTVLGAEPAMADDALRSLRAGERLPVEHPQTIADGLRTSLGELTVPIIERLVDDILLASEDAIKKAMRLIIERSKLLVEPSAAVPLAAMLEHPAICAGHRIGIILSGGNVDLSTISEVIA